jgi:type I restriction enzyme S subunit
MREGWVELSLGELTENTRPICYGVLKPGPQVEGGVPLVKITDMDRRILGPEGMQQVSNELDNEFRRSRLQGGEVLLSIQGTVGRVAIAASTLKGANISRTIAVIDPDDRLHNFYLMYVLEKIATQGEFDSAGSTRESLNISTIRDMRISCPPVPEQKRIVDLISSVDSYIEALQHQLESAKRSRNAVLHELLTAGGDDWVESKLGQYIYINTGKLDVNASSEFGEFPFFTCSRETYRIDEAAFEGESVIVAGNGDLNVKYYDGKFNAYQRTYVLNSVSKNVLDNQFLFLYMQTYIEYLRSETRGTVIQYLKKGQFTDATIVLPPLPEQKRIVELISEMDEFIESIQQTSIEARNLRSGLLSDLLSGTHEIPVSYDKVIGAA